MSGDGWHEANQRYLAAAVALLGESLARAAGEEPEAEAAAELTHAREALPAPAALDEVCAAFGLSPFERDVLVLCAGVDLDASFAKRCAALQRDSASPTFGLALALLPDAHWSALAPAAPLRRWRLVEVGAGETLTRSPLRIDERVLHHLAGVGYLDERLEGLVRPVVAPDELAASHRALADRLAASWRLGSGFVQLVAADGAAARMAAAAAAANVGCRLFALRAADVPASVVERAALARLWEREAALAPVVLLVECDHGDEAVGAALALLEELRAPTLAVAGELLPVRRPALRFDIPRLRRAEQRDLWAQVLDGIGAPRDGNLDRLALEFDLGIGSFEAAWTQAAATVAAQPEVAVVDAVWEACRAQARGRLDDLAQRIEPTASWDDLVVPEAERDTLREIAVHVRRRATVYERWGFAAASARGLGISALFTGPSGTGKTMASEVLARELALDLYRIDLSQVISKYIGETEKNLRRVFDAAESGGAILLFDEADALFGKRSEVRDSHDRYANIEVSYLLQRMEAYRGLAILTTNRKEALDQAFLRRIRFVVRFPFPDATQRAEIWRRTFPAATPTSELDVVALARLNVAGGNIRNIALGAAFRAADEDAAVGMEHMLAAARREYAKLERTLTPAEAGAWR